MNKIVLITFCVLSWLLMWIVSSHAAPVGNPTRLTEPQKNSVSAGYEGSIVFDRDLEKNNAELDELQDSYAKLSYIPEELPVEFYGLLGTMRLEAKQGNAQYDTDFGFAYGFGATTQLWNNDEGTAIGLDGKYRRSKPDIDDSTFNNNGRAKYQDWQVALGISQQIEENLTPYGGIKYNDVSITGVPGFAGQNSDHVIGLFAGLDMDASKNLSFNLEGSFITETAVSGAATWRF